MPKLREQLPIVWFLSILTLIMTFSAGVDAGRQEWQQASIGLAFAALIAAFTYAMFKVTIGNSIEQMLKKVDVLEQRIANGSSRGIQEVLEQAINDLPNFHDDALQFVLDHITAEIAPDESKPLTIDQIESIRQKFNEQTGHHVKITKDESGHMLVEFGETAFPPEKPKAHKREKSGKQVAIKTEDKPPVSPKRPLDANRKKSKGVEKSE